jgi:endonuclease/exonuclease/phosphatase family metal-dependent hydrolase
VGVLSRWPIESALTLGRPFHHSLLQLRIAGLQLWIAHLTPVDVASRQVEADWIAAAARSSPSADAPLLLVGDLNTLSPLDEAAHRRSGLRERLQAEPALRRKFLRDDGEIDRAPLQTLHAAGLTELRLPDVDQVSVPTPWNRDPAHAAPMRLDHALANRALLDRGARARIECGEAVAQLSDHYPLVIELDIELDLAPGSKPG